MLRAHILAETWGLVLAALATAPVAQAQSAEDKLHRAYYLEHARRQTAAAVQAYDEVAGDRRADAGLRAEAQARAEECREELASADFASLMPANALAYVELNSPGEQMARLLKMLGLLREDGSLTVDPERRLAVSPALVRGLLGIRGVAAAVTGFDPTTRQPLGVAVLHPGEMEVIRGLIETALPAGAQIVEPIAGFPTYNVSGQAYVTLTRRLVLVSSLRDEIEGVILRLKGEEGESLADNPDLAEVLKQRDQSLLFFCLNFKPLTPLLNAGLAAAGTQSREVALAQALLDPKSLRTLVGRMGVGDAGLYLEMTLRLDESHRNLVFQFLRMPPIRIETLKRVPAGAAGFLAAALNEPGHYRPPSQPEGERAAAVTMLDIGREIFANVVSVAVFAVAGEEAPTGGAPSLPPVGAVITVNDARRSLALWNELLGVASLACGAGTLEGIEVEIAGVKARRFIFPEGISVYLAAAGSDVIISPSKGAVAQSLATLRGGESVLNDAAFARSLERLGTSATFALFVHPGRCARLALPFMGRGQMREIEPIVQMLPETVASVVVEHSNEAFRFSAMVTGLPDVGPLVSRLIAEQQAQDALRQQWQRAWQRGQWDEGLEAVRRMAAQRPGDGELLWEEFRILAAGKRDREAALAVGEKLYEALRDDAMRLNNRAWALLTEAEFADGYAELALKLSRRANELTGHSDWRCLDTLALALFKTGDTQAAIETEKKAIALCGSSSGRRGLEAALERFQSALTQ